MSLQTGAKCVPLVDEDRDMRGLIRRMAKPVSPAQMQPSVQLLASRSR